jgi:tRNA(fMet)-specific endonuclease VapC
MAYLLDSNTIIEILNDGRSPAARRVLQESVSEVAISSIVVHELYYGAFRSRRAVHYSQMVDGLRFPVIDFDRNDARQAGTLRALLANQGTPIGPYDVLIAGQALVRNLTLVTHNTREFARVPGLRVEDWHS